MLKAKDLAAEIELLGQVRWLRAPELEPVQLQLELVVEVEGFEPG